jgi:tyrosinase
MADALTAPGDPIFFLHRMSPIDSSQVILYPTTDEFSSDTNLDRLFWEWQQTSPAHLTDISGSNTPSDDFNRGNNWAPPGREFTDFSGDGGSTTTMGHVLWMIGILPNVTVGDVMDLRGEVICAE